MTAQPIFTSSWFVKLPMHIARIGISRGTPRGQPAGYRRFTALNPGPWFNSCSSTEEYTQRYSSEILAKLDPGETVKQLLKMGDGRAPALLCFEDPHPNEQWCHRALVSVWLFDRLGLEVFEYGQEQQGCGHMHPKLDPRVRRLAMPAKPSPDRSAEILPLVGKCFLYGNGRKKAYQVMGVHPEHLDQCVISDGKTEMPVHVDVVKKHVEA